MKNTLTVLTLATALTLTGCSLGSSDNNTTNNTDPVEAPEGEGASRQSVTVDPADSTIPQSELAKHSTKDDCWLAIDGKVYNVTSYVAAHPGGEEILKGCGQDATQMFELHDHGAAAELKREELFIGNLE